MLHIECLDCGTSSYVDCSCASAGHDPGAAGAHHPDCSLTDLGATVNCPPGDCCDGSAHAGLSHDLAANACPGGHGDCPVPKKCKVWASTTANTRHPQYSGEPPGDCPGGHCHKDIPDCTVCRPVRITVMPGSTVIQAVA